MQKIDVWYKAKGKCPAAEFELASFLLFEAGVETLEELDGEDPAVAEFQFYTGERAERDRIAAAFPAYEFELSEEPARDWDAWWRERAKPVHVSERLWVRPPWVEFTPETGRDVVLELEAKTAFGTGEHETTSSVACLMEAVDFAGKSVLDIGTGTGILAMFARRLGAALAVGTEIDPLALTCIQENFERNGFGTSDCVLGFLDAFKEGAAFDVILCNMIRSELWPLRDDIEALLGEGGTFIVSGQLAEEKGCVLAWFEECGLQVKAELEKGEWWSARAERSRK